jgi:hypothetical protein
MVTDCEDASNELLLQIKEADRGLRDKIISFQKLHAASASGDINKDYEDKNSLINNTIALNEKVNIICKQLIARLIGGIGPKLDGTSSTFAGVHNEDDCDRFIEFANDKFPDSSQYGEFASMIQYAKDMGIKIAKFNKMIFELKSKGENVFSHEDDLKKMYNVFNVKTDGDYLTAKATLEKKLKKNDADFNKELKSLTKGIIYTWDFTVENTVMVPEEYKSVDDKKIKSFIKDHKEGLEGRITKLPNGEQVLNEQPIPGIILFRKEQKRMS